MTGMLKLPPTKMRKVVDRIIGDRWGEDQEFSFEYAMLEIPSGHGTGQVK